jgi:YidC/Oxa1 family membrane protein insertase
MDNIRVLLWVVFLTMLWLSYNQWIQDFAVEPAPAATQAPDARDASNAVPELPALPTDDEPPSLDDTQRAQLPDIRTESADLLEPIRVRTDVLDVVINSRGGDLVRVDLLQYPVEKERPEELVRLLDYDPERFWVFQTGLRSTSHDTEATHAETFRATASEYALREDEDELNVSLEWIDTGAVRVRKTYTFHRGRYDLDLRFDVDNGSTEVWRGAPYARIERLHVPVKRSFRSVDSYSFRGPVFYDGDSYEKLDFDDLAESPLSQTVMNGWLASIQHHFLAAVVPPADTDVRYEAVTRGGDYLLTAVGGIAEVAPQSSVSFPLQLFVGPKLQHQLEATRDGLELTVDYGLLTVLAQPLFWLLEQAHRLVGNWGWSIIIVTFLIKLAFYKLTATSGRSMAKMRKIAPRMKALQERYKDDRQKLSQAMMDLYKKEKVNPAAGCLPILIQMPFFFAFYWVLIESVEMRQAPFMLWIDDLSRQDPFYILPLLMGVAMFLNSRLTPTPPDPVQARIMQIMPIAFTAFFVFFPAGLVLYWLTNTLLSILQQWRINKIVAAES